MGKLVLMSEEELESMLKECVRSVLEEHLAAPPNDPEPEFLDVTQACQLLHLARQTIYGLTSRGQIPYMKSRHKLVFRKADLIEWVENGKHEPLYFD